MSRTKIAWESVRAAYEQGAVPRALAQQYSVSPSSVYRHIRGEGWVFPSGERSPAKHAAPRKKKPAAPPSAKKQLSAGSVFPQLYQAARRLQSAAAAMLTAAESGDAVSIRDVKDLASLLRELNALAISLNESDSGPDLVRVVLEPPLDQWAL